MVGLMCFIVLYCIVFLLYHTVSYCTPLYFTVLYCIALDCIRLYRIVFCNVLYCIVVALGYYGAPQAGMVGIPPVSYPTGLSSQPLNAHTNDGRYSFNPTLNPPIPARYLCYLQTIQCPIRTGLQYLSWLFRDLEMSLQRKELYPISGLSIASRLFTTRCVGSSGWLWYLRVWYHWYRHGLRHISVSVISRLASHATFLPTTTSNHQQAFGISAVHFPLSMWHWWTPVCLYSD